VPFGTASRTGVIVAVAAASEQPHAKLKAVSAILRDMPPLPAEWLALCEFCARYYQTPLGEVTSFALPPMLRRGKLPRLKQPAEIAASPAPTPEIPRLMAAQQSAVKTILAATSFQTMLLHGVTAAARPRSICARSTPCWRAAARR
jgi:primosomal protein N' (replication factor Y)